MKTLIVYFSLDGSTRFMANLIARELDADILELKTIKPYPTNLPAKMIVGGASAILLKTPLLINKVPDMSCYDTVFIGTPIWAGKYAPPIASFLKRTDITNKKVGLFLSCGGGSPKGCIEKFKIALKDNEMLGELCLKMPVKKRPEDVEASIQSFLASLGLI